MKTLMIVFAVLTSTQSFAQGGGSTAGGGNPADLLCIQKGGKVEIVQALGGEMGICALGRARIEAWTLLRELSGTKSTAIKKLVQGANKDGLLPGNPASVYCTRMGGKVIIVDTNAGQYGLCQFKDKSIIEEWTLFRGATDSTNRKLSNVLGL